MNKVANDPSTPSLHSYSIITEADTTPSRQANVVHSNMYDLTRCAGSIDPSVPSLHSHSILID